MMIKTKEKIVNTFFVILAAKIMKNKCNKCLKKDIK